MKRYYATRLGNGPWRLSDKVSSPKEAFELCWRRQATKKDTIIDLGTNEGDASEKFFVLVQESVEAVDDPNTT